MSRLPYLLFLSSSVVLSASVYADEGKTEDSFDARYAYSIGYQMGQSLKIQGINSLDTKALTEGLNDALKGSRARLDNIEMKDAMASYPAYVKRLHKQDARGNLAEAKIFLTQNAKRKGVHQTRSGLQYEILQKGSGQQPSSKDSVLVHYQGSFMDGSIFDSSIAREEPANFNMGMVIPGFREALSTMHVGEKWKIYVPPALAYGSKGVKGSIGANELLIFEIELLDIL